MLTTLNIRGLALADAVTIEFDRGFSVLTGETGAGKSMVVKALGFLLGGRANQDMVRAGAAEAVVCGNFAVPGDHSVTQELAQLGLQVSCADDGSISIILRRHLSDKGKSSAYLNDIPVTASAMRQIGARLVDVFGQHDNHRLLHASQHIDFIDLFLKKPAIKDEYAQAYADLCARIAETETFLASIADRSRNRDFVVFRVEEIRQFAPTQTDYDQLANLTESAKDRVARREAFTAAQQAIDASDSQSDAVSRRVFDAARLLAKAKIAGGQDVEQLVARCQLAGNELEDISFQISRLLESLEINDSELESAEERLSGYQSLVRKLGCHDVAGLVVAWEQLETDLQLIDNAGDTVAAQMDTIDRLLQDGLRIAAALTKERARAAQVIRADVSEHLESMAMPGALIEVEFTAESRAVAAAVNVELLSADVAARWSRIQEARAKLGPNGQEHAVIVAQINKGEGRMPLHKIASGGELSRVMLALKTVSAMESEPSVLIFDEIDAGISGKVADTVGKKLALLARSFQVISVSHLPQVAAYATNHFSVRKFASKSRTASRVDALDEIGRTQELARLVSGTDVTEQGLANAKNLLQRARAATEALM